MKKQSCVVASYCRHEFSCCELAWQCCTVPVSGFYLHYFLWCICL